MDSSHNPPDPTSSTQLTHVINGSARSSNGMELRECINPHTGMLGCSYVPRRPLTDPMAITEEAQRRLWGQRKLDVLKSNATSTIASLNLRTSIRGLIEKIQNREVIHGPKEAWQNIRTALEGFIEENYTKSSKAKVSDYSEVESEFNSMITLNDAERQLNSHIVRFNNETTAFDTMMEEFLKKDNPTQASIFTDRLELQRQREIDHLLQACSNSNRSRANPKIEILKYSVSAIDYLISQRGSDYQEIFFIGHRCKSYFSDIQVRKLRLSASTKASNIKSSNFYTHWGNECKKTGQVDHVNKANELLDAVRKRDTEVTKVYATETIRSLLDGTEILSKWDQSQIQIQILDHRAHCFTLTLCDLKSELEEIRELEAKHF
uniref:Uncharacterized protein n=1 Tax=Kwoniella pini CBS 10737 TaxID=1296096 RepID=A0A1B9HUM3_9TREE|nr:uncharacterized protein I206_06746 [Kwoniella pini CBS 10737]OCF46972.1 hypothetical protein I206_06746 [Kwoniella pini CBS 10737]